MSSSKGAHFLLYFSVSTQTYSTSSDTMLETCRRSHTSHSLRVHRLDWNTLDLPGKSEEFDSEAFTQETDPWFRAKCSLVYQQPSVVLVEKIVVNPDTDVQNKVGKEQSTKQQGGTKPEVRSGLPPGPCETSYVTRRLELSTGKSSKINYPPHTLIKQKLQLRAMLRSKIDILYSPPDITKEIKKYFETLLWLQFLLQAKSQIIL